MNRVVTRFIRTLPAIVRNTHIDVSLSGWPATVAILGACGTAAWVAWIALKTPEEPQQNQQPKQMKQSLHSTKESGSASSIPSSQQTGRSVVQL